MSRPKKLAPDAVSFGQGWPLPMTADERAAAENALGAAIPDEAWVQVEKAREGFIVARRREAGGVTLGELKSRLEQHRATWSAFLATLRPADKIDVTIWARLQTPLDLPSRHVYNALLATEGDIQIGAPLSGPVLGALFVVATDQLRRMDAEIESLAREENSWRDTDRTAAEARDSAGAPGKFRYFDGFVAELAGAALAAGVRPTAAKSSNARNPRPSSFVAFVAAILATMPEADRVAVASDGALAKHIATALSLWRKKKV